MAYRETVKFLKFQEQNNPEDFKLVLVPKDFHNDCVNSSNEKYPRILNETSTHYWINTLEDKSKTQELILSAEVYCELHKLEPQDYPLVCSAKETLQLLQGAA